VSVFAALERRLRAIVGLVDGVRRSAWIARWVAGIALLAL